ncbi:MAG: hypothetical protein Q4E53_12905 [Eubacteriales bacterium]|nr:hypothetical protein [Eubacteriales bacterium]
MRKKKRNYILKKIIFTESFLLVSFALIAFFGKIPFLSFMPMVVPATAIIVIIYLILMIYDSLADHRVRKKMLNAMENGRKDFWISPYEYTYEREKMERMGGDFDYSMESIVFRNTRTHQNIVFGKRYSNIYYDSLEKRKIYRFVKFKKYLLIIKES